MDRLQSMKVFERIASDGSFAAAARSLGVSAPVVTRLVADLEKHLGVRLLQRSTRSLSLTAAGSSYLSRVRSILQDVEEADEAVRTEAQEPAGLLRVHVPPSLANHLMAPSLVLFRQRYPRIRLDLDISSSEYTTMEGFDASLMVVDQSFDGAVVARKLSEGDVILVASPEYLSRKGSPTQPEDLSHHDCLRLKHPMASGRTWSLWQSGAEQQVLEVPVMPTIESNHSDLLLTAALDGGGITPVSLVMAAPHLASGQLVRVLSPWIVGRFTVYAVLPTHKFIPRRTQVFLDFLLEQSSVLIAAAQQKLEGLGCD